MGKYLVIWQFDADRSFDPQKLGETIKSLFSLTKKFVQKNVIKDWGAFVGQTGGYAIIEATEREAGEIIKKFVKHVNYTSYRIASLAQMDDLVAKLLKD